MNRRAKACAISQRVKTKVYERDNGICIYCGGQGAPNAHYIRRSQGGLGIEQNIITLCIRCHKKYDEYKDNNIKLVIESHLTMHYGKIDKSKLIYNKYKWLKEISSNVKT